MRRKFLVGFLLVILALVISGCTVIGLPGSEQPIANDGGVYKSTDKGETLVSKVLVPTTTGTPAAINTVNVNKLLLDPQDSSTIYLASNGQNLFFSYDGADSWLRPRERLNEMSVINDVAIDAKDSCHLYVAATNRIFKSTNCGRTWKQIYITDRAENNVYSVAVDFYNPNIVYAGTQVGDIMKSTDAGISWQTIKRVSRDWGQEVIRILIDSQDTRRVYFATKNAGLYKTTDAGNSWVEINDQGALKDLPGAMDFKDLVQDTTKRNSFILVSNWGLLRTTDGGQTWQNIELLSSTGKDKILAVAIDPENSDGLYYCTDTIFVRSLDGGTSWISQNLPTSRACSGLIIDPKNPKIVYMGVKQK
ncbi:MAG: YCF48-related protein [Patescibacteria group bacterium]